MSSTLFIDLNTMQHNLNEINKKLKKDVQRMAVIKDNAYGHGIVRISKFLKDKVEWFCVARLDEAILIRENGITNPVLVFEIPPKGMEDAYINYKLTASIADLSVFERLKAGTDCHIKFDTGMGRLGLMPEDASFILEKMKTYKHLNYKGIYTHFANADVPGHPSVLKQLEKFKIIRSHFPEQLMTHTANSGAIFYFQDYDLQFDAVRPGVCLYGYSPGETEVPQLKAAAVLRSELAQVKKVKKGATVGYGSRWTAPKDGWLGIIPAGYAHGISRNLSGKFEVEIDGKLFQQVGTISMDYSAVFLDDHQAVPGTTVTLLNNSNLKVKRWAKLLDTIPYEIVTRISNEVKREYI